MQKIYLRPPESAELLQFGEEHGSSMKRQKLYETQLFMFSNPIIKHGDTC